LHQRLRVACIATQPIMAFHSMLPENNTDYEH